MVTMQAFTDEAWACERCDGAERWYRRKGRWIRRHARAAGMPPAQAIAAYAILSIDCTLQTNDQWFLEHLAGSWSVGRYGDGRRRLRLAADGRTEEALTF